MHPAPSVILFTVFSGFGFGLLAALGVSAPAPFVLWVIGYAFAVGGLLASTFHLGHPERAWRAFSQWRSSWLSREGIAAVACLILLAPQAVCDGLGQQSGRAFGIIGALLAVATIACTAMIYAQIRAVPRWNHWTTPAQFAAFALSGGAMVMAGPWVAVACLGLLAASLVAHWHFGDRRFAQAGATLTTATGLGQGGTVSVFEPAHTAGNYLLREMIFVVGRKHVTKLRRIAMIFACVLPALCLALMPLHPLTQSLAVVLHLTGACAARWLFFAQAEHVVGLYYGHHGR